MTSVLGRPSWSEGHGPATVNWWLLSATSVSKRRHLSQSIRYPPDAAQPKKCPVLHDWSTTPHFASPPFPRRLFSQERTPPASPTPSPQSGVTPPEGEGNPTNRTNAICTPLTQIGFPSTRNDKILESGCPLFNRPPTLRNYKIML